MVFLLVVDVGHVFELDADFSKKGKATCPFPDCTEVQMNRIRKLAETLDAHRKRAQAGHGLGLTDIYNVLEKVRGGNSLTPKDKKVHEAGLGSTLQQIHGDLDVAVADAYGWPWPLSDDEILQRIVALNTKRAAEEAGGHIRWLRPDYQKPLYEAKKSKGKQATLDLTEGAEAKPAKRKLGQKLPWPKTGPERSKAINEALAAETNPVTATDLTKRFSRAQADDVLEILQTLATLGLAHYGDQPDTFLK